MADFTRALLLPDVVAPSDRLLKTLAIYWDKLVVPEYLERALENEPLAEGSTFRSAVFKELEEQGVLVREPRAAQLPPVHRSELPKELRDVPAPNDVVLRLVAISQGMSDFKKKEPNPDRDALGRALLTKMLDYSARHYGERVSDSFALSAGLNLAPVATSTLSHLASLLTGDSGEPQRQATMLSAVIQGFEIDPNTSVKRILQFRDKNATAVGRFRASVMDLSEGLRVDANPTRLLSEARDRYLNRVVPALGDLEAALSSGRVGFLLKSLVGASIVTVSPMQPSKAIEGGATLVGQTVNYAFSRERLIREHPFGYLYRVSDSGIGTRRGTQDDLGQLVDDPVTQIREMFINDLRADALNSPDDFWFGTKVLEQVDEQMNLESGA